jgi:hypothetical protein
MSSASIHRRMAAVALPLALGALYLAPTASAGSFVIGDGNAAVGTEVTFWGAKWWKLNSLSRGAAPPAFKGWASSFSAPACGLPWTTAPGNSSEPPEAPLPEFIEVVVSTHISKEGPTIFGDAPKVVLVKTNSGYASNPGHAGTGTVVGVVCEENEIR